MFLLYAALAAWALLPVGFKGFVATNVDILGGKDFTHLVEHGIHESQRRVVAGTKDGFWRPIWADGHLIGIVVACKFRIGGKDCRRMARHLNLGYHLYAAHCGVFDNLGQLLAAVESTIGGALTITRRSGFAPRLIVAVNTP